MEDPRLLVAVSGGLAALATGAVGVATNAPVLAVVAGAAGVVAAMAGVALGAQARRNGDQLGQAEHELRTVRRELASINAVLQEESSRRTAEQELGPPADLGRERNDKAFDTATGLYDERYFAVLVQQHVAATRRSLRPVSVVIFEIDSMGEADADTRQQALGVVGDVVRRTLPRERRGLPPRRPDGRRDPGRHPEAGTVWAAERVRGTLLASPIGDALTLSAGVACYPTHALGAAELVHQASGALNKARWPRS